MLSRRTTASALLILGLLGLTHAEPEQDKPAPKIGPEHYRVYRGNGDPISFDDMSAELAKAQVVFIGEEHDDAVAHHLELRILERLTPEAEGKLALSLEMFERDVQHVLDEYLAGQITERHLKASGRSWQNYDKDYRPLVEHARRHGLRVLAANAPRRYVNLVSREGAGALTKIDKGRLRGLPPLPYGKASPAYTDRFKKIMEEHSKPAKDKKKAEKPAAEKKKPAPKKPARTFDLARGLEAQSLWDAGMAYSIAQHLRASQEQVVHVNGRFHSEKRLGIPEHLLRYRKGVKFLVVTILPDKGFPKFDAKKQGGLGDFVIVTDADLPRSYGEEKPKKK